MATKPKLRGLGRGLDALLAGNAESDRAASSDALTSLPIAKLQAGKYQPRTRMDQASLNELAESIKAQGIIQPILVRKIATDKYEILAGERRFRAAQIAGLKEVPVALRDVPDESALAIALIENIQREDLNAIEEAQGIKRLVDEFGMTHEKAAQAVGRSRSAATNLLRLLQLPKPVQDMLHAGELDMGHARALLPLDAAKQLQAAREIKDKALSVRAAETLAHDLLNGKSAASKSKTKAPAKNSKDTQRLEEELSERLGTTVAIVAAKKGGKLVIAYSDFEHLDDLLKRIN
jgi:ParB family transcriptional regulator, chromosome partitioning protein